MSPTGEELYKQREQRFNDVVALKKPDRVPVVPLACGYFADLWKGFSYKEAGFNHPRTTPPSGMRPSSSAGTSRR